MEEKLAFLKKRQNLNFRESIFEIPKKCLCVVLIVGIFVKQSVCKGHKSKSNDTDNIFEILKKKFPFFPGFLFLSG